MTKQATAEISDESWLLYVRCVAGMATDELLGRGPTREAFIQNLRIIADQMEAVNAEITRGKMAESDTNSGNAARS